LIVTTKEMADYFDAGAKSTKDVKGLANWILGDVSAYMNNKLSPLISSRSLLTIWLLW
jgi:aspartyl-tRNA(Asn)/glutamyl-tRNA(Gln) amidotransferase subunit B